MKPEVTKRDEYSKKFQKGAWAWQISYVKKIVFSILEKYEKPERIHKEIFGGNMKNRGIVWGWQKIFSKIWEIWMRNMKNRKENMGSYFEKYEKQWHSVRVTKKALWESVDHLSTVPPLCRPCHPDWWIIIIIVTNFYQSDELWFWLTIIILMNSACMVSMSRPSDELSLWRIIMIIMVIMLMIIMIIAVMMMNYLSL